jgi:hypothetical protein
MGLLLNTSMNQVRVYMSAQLRQVLNLQVLGGLQHALWNHTFVFVYGQSWQRCLSVLMQPSCLGCWAGVARRNLPSCT